MGHVTALPYWHLICFRRPYHMTAGVPLWPISAHVLLSGFCFLRPQWYPKPVEPDSSAERTALKQERGFSCSTHRTLRKDDACWQRGAAVFLSDYVTLESSDLSLLLYLHSEKSKAGHKAHSRHFHAWLISYCWSDWQSPDRAAPEALQSTDQPFRSSFMDDAFLAHWSLTPLSLLSSLLITCLMLFLPLFTPPPLPFFPQPILSFTVT